MPAHIRSLLISEEPDMGLRMTQNGRTVSRPLVSSEQTAQRAELRAVLAALAIESRPLHVRSDSQYVVNGVQHLL